MTNNVVSLAC